MFDKIAKTLRLKNRPLYMHVRRGTTRNFFTSQAAAKKEEVALPPQKNSSFSSLTFVTGIGLNQEILPQNQDRLFLIVQNNDATNNCWLSFGAPADATGLIVPPLGTLIIDQHAPVNSINVYATAVVTLTVIEGK